MVVAFKTSESVTSFVRAQLKELVEWFDTCISVLCFVRKISARFCFVMMVQGIRLHQRYITTLVQQRAQHQWL